MMCRILLELKNAIFKIKKLMDGVKRIMKKTV